MKKQISVQASVSGGGDFFPYGHSITLAEMIKLFRDLELEEVQDAGDSIFLHASKINEEAEDQEEGSDLFENWSFWLPKSLFVRYPESDHEMMTSFESSFEKVLWAIGNTRFREFRSIQASLPMGKQKPIEPEPCRYLEACQTCFEFVAGMDTHPLTQPEWIEHIANRVEQLQGDLATLYPGDPEETNEFSWRKCEICGTTLGGSRHQVALIPNVQIQAKGGN